MPTTTSTNQGAFPNVSYFPAEDIVADALVLQVTDQGPAVEGDQPSVRVPYVTDVAAGFVAEGANIDESDPTLAEIVVNTDKIAVLTKVSNEAYRTGGVAGLLTNSLRRSVITKADTAFLTNPSNPTGLGAVTGIVNGGEITTNLDALVDAIATVEDNGATPSHIIASPKAWAAVLKLKVGSDYNTPLLGATSDTAARQLLGIPVLINKAAADNTLLVVDRSQIVSSVGQVAVATSSDRYFDDDSVGVRVTLRFGWGVVRPDRLAKLTIAE
ncbi:phage major capsid protein [Pseudoclavibacter sp. CFCC 13611]|uniref:phage major capsid protein n=1 Tax=Pseudoclavibacter sp. CFCC 13611 TaxID=2615178 RepID=UPI0013016F7A|nr:phage major capsid protein [Pseudoclavibacter sp. CFCC 13611]KAB1662922.1 phage major capsid protein [Pseudoclavibacter sp. CFCC 13611]